MIFQNIYNQSAQSECAGASTLIAMLTMTYDDYDHMITARIVDISGATLSSCAFQSSKFSQTGSSFRPPKHIKLNVCCISEQFTALIVGWHHGGAEIIGLETGKRVHSLFHNSCDKNDAVSCVSCIHGTSSGRGEILSEATISVGYQSGIIHLWQIGRFSKKLLAHFDSQDYGISLSQIRLNEANWRSQMMRLRKRRTISQLLDVQEMLKYGLQRQVGTNTM